MPSRGTSQASRGNPSLPGSLLGLASAWTCQHCSWTSFHHQIGEGGKLFSKILEAAALARYYDKRLVSPLTFPNKVQTPREPGSFAQPFTAPYPTNVVGPL